MQVTWDQNKCCHAGLCVNSLPSVFKVVGDQLIIDPSGADKEDIMAVVNRCLAGALSCASSYSEGNS